MRRLSGATTYVTDWIGDGCRFSKAGAVEVRLHPKHQRRPSALPIAANLHAAGQARSIGGDAVRACRDLSGRQEEECREGRPGVVGESVPTTNPADAWASQQTARY